ncbi:hypothetical protein B0T18DRAFT_386818 [Schizothecium vesticola]|uniref:Uncharacterized protein n=1 Tax=Schizothecium vesticola TaxID=314040 RepID=A0AA40FCA2_9PEZI|nr:hypothetical protein B0T18DRAFT_386818 [Schizothecium vesticola]
MEEDTNVASMRFFPRGRDEAVGSTSSPSAWTGQIISLQTTFMDRLHQPFSAACGLMRCVAQERANDTPRSSPDEGAILSSSELAESNEEKAPTELGDGDGRAPTNIDEKLRTSSPTMFGRWPLAAVPAERLHNCKPVQGRKTILDAHGADAGESLAVPGCVAAEEARRAMPLASGANASYDDGVPHAAEKRLEGGSRVAWPRRWCRQRHPTPLRPGREPGTACRRRPIAGPTAITAASNICPTQS